MKHIPQTVQIVEDEHQKSFPRIVANMGSEDNHSVLMDELAKRRYKVLTSESSKFYHLDLRKLPATDVVQARIPAELMNGLQSRLVGGTWFSMVWAEMGGWHDYKNEANNFGLVVCNSKGHKIKPFHVTNHADWGNDFKFSFDLGIPAVTVRSTCREIITIEEHTLELHFNHELVSVKTELLWTGKSKELPPELSRFAEGVLAASEKANCQHCDHLHFGVEPVKR